MDYEKNPILSTTTERDMDLLFVEEFRCSDDFVDWFLLSVSHEIASLKNLTVISKEVFHSVSRTGKASGESDIEVSLKCKKKFIKLFIEDKIDAQFQENQSQRYQLRTKEEVRSGECDEAYCILIAPNEYLESNTDSHLFDSTISYEGVIEFLDSRNNKVSDELALRLSHKIDLLNQSIYKYRRGYCLEANEKVTNFWNNYYLVAKEKYSNLKMRNPGNKPIGSTFVHFVDAINSTLPLPKCAIQHKLGHARVDLEFFGWTKHWDAIEHDMSNLLKDDMELRKAARSMAVSISVPMINVLLPFKEQEDAALDGLDNACRLLGWYNQNIGALKEIANKLSI